MSVLVAIKFSPKDLCLTFLFSFDISDIFHFTVFIKCCCLGAPTCDRYLQNSCDRLAVHCVESDMDIKLHDDSVRSPDHEVQLKSCFKSNERERTSVPSQHSFILPVYSNGYYWHVRRSSNNFNPMLSERMHLLDLPKLLSLFLENQKSGWIYNSIVRLTCSVLCFAWHPFFLCYISTLSSYQVAHSIPHPMEQCPPSGTPFTNHFQEIYRIWWTLKVLWKKLMFLQETFPIKKHITLETSIHNTYLKDRWKCFTAFKLPLSHFFLFLA